MRKLSGGGLVVVLLAVLAGCAPQGAGTTPEATVTAYLAAVKSGDAYGVTRLYDYVTYAKSQNSDWDSIPPGERDLIVDKLAQDKAKDLKDKLPDMKKALTNAEIGVVHTGNGRSQVDLQGAPTIRSLQLVNNDGKWYIVAE
jgi:hypothetical protein